MNNNIEIYPINGELFSKYGKVHKGYDTSELCQIMTNYKIPDAGTCYIPSVPELEKCEPIFSILRNSFFGGLPIQLGMCMGKNKQLNCLEYHRCNEILIGTHDYIILVAHINEIEEGCLDTRRVKAFYAPAKIPIEIFSSTLHYSPCNVDESAGFHVAVALIQGTNTDLDRDCLNERNGENKLLVSKNKWILSHAESDEAKKGQPIGLIGCNITLDI